VLKVAGNLMMQELGAMLEYTGGPKSKPLSSIIVKSY